MGIGFLFSVILLRTLLHSHRIPKSIPNPTKSLRNDVPDFRKSTRTITLPLFLLEFLYWRMNWHIEHHMFAAVPCYNLRKLHEAVKGDMPKPRSLVGAWLEMWTIWRRQLEEPEWQFDTEVPGGEGDFGDLEEGGKKVSSVGVRLLYIKESLMSTEFLKRKLLSKQPPATEADAMAADLGDIAPDGLKETLK